MNTITASEASAFQQAQVTTAVDAAVAVKAAQTQRQAEGGVLQLVSAAMAVVQASTAPMVPAAEHAVDVVA